MPGGEQTWTDAMRRLGHATARQRDLAAAELGDWLRSGALDDDSAELVVSRLVAVAVTERVYAVREQALHAVGEASDHYRLRFAVVEPLVPVVESLTPDLIEYTLQIFALTGDPVAKRVIDGFSGHPDSAVLQAAADALTEFRGS